MKSIDDIWFDLHIGKIRTDEKGERIFTDHIKPESVRLTLTDKHIEIDEATAEQLHFMLDKAIKRVNERLARETS